MKMSVHEGFITEYVQPENIEKNQSESKPDDSALALSAEEKAIEVIQELRKKYAANPETRYLMALIMAESALREKAERENLQPLTLEELKERLNNTKGTPIFITPPEGYKGEWGDAWYIFPWDYKDFKLEMYGITWLAYDHEPKGE